MRSTPYPPNLEEAVMILVRNVFYLKFGKAKEAKTLIDENKKMMKKFDNNAQTRFLTDITGPFYTLVMEITANNLGDFEKTSAEMMKNSEFEDWYKKFIPLVESGKREIFSVLE
jgi:hypothetical protein